jgi:hypothetical protein
MLLKSCAMPPASPPIASIFWACDRRASVSWRSIAAATPFAIACMKFTSCGVKRRTVRACAPRTPYGSPPRRSMRTLTPLRIAAWSPLGVAVPKRFSCRKSSTTTGCFVSKQCPAWDAEPVPTVASPMSSAGHPRPARMWKPSWLRRNSRISQNSRPSPSHTFAAASAMTASSSRVWMA